MIRPLLIMLMFTCSSPAYAHADTINGQVVKVADGDTITVQDNMGQKHQIRLAGIDAPEMNQPYGLNSKNSLRSLVAGQTVTVEYKKRDRYGRIIGKVLFRGGDICLEQVKVGLAWHYKFYQREQSKRDRHLYTEHENDAQLKLLGLWADPEPMPPWEWRRK